MQTVLLLAPLLLSDTLIDPREMEILAGFLLTPVAFGTNLIELLVIPAIALEAADVVETALVVHAGGQRLDTQVKGYDPIRMFIRLRYFIDKRAIIVATRISRACPERLQEPIETLVVVRNEQYDRIRENRGEKGVNRGKEERSWKSILLISPMKNGRFSNHSSRLRSQVEDHEKLT